MKPGTPERHTQAIWGAAAAAATAAAAYSFWGRNRTPESASPTPNDANGAQNISGLGDDLRSALDHSRSSREARTARVTAPTSPK